MKKTKEELEAEQAFIAQQAALEGEDDGEAGLDEETASEAEEASLSAAEEDKTEEALDLDWKGARAHLKKADAACGFTIDDYFKRVEVNTIKNRYNAKERTESLYDAIMNLEV